MNQEEQKTPELKERPLKLQSSTKFILNIAIVVFLLLTGYFAFAYLSHTLLDSHDEQQAAKPKPVHVIQLDVLNGCGAKGVASRCTNFLRTSGFDVVEMKNYKTFNIPQTLVIDRVGNLEMARRVAAVLGVSEKNIIQQINPDYFVDVSVVIGNDYSALVPWRQH